MKIEEGKFYRTRDGRKAGPIQVNIGGLSGFPWEDNNDVFSCWRDDGTYDLQVGKEHPLDLIAEWFDVPASPVRTRTVTEIVNGVYGRVEVYRYPDKTAGIRLKLKNGRDAGESYAALNAAELRAAAAVFVQLADALEGGAA